MNREQTPLLSVGIIFKNEIRCIERCLQSLLVLKDALPCEIVMADTGSGDGSREIAERYADAVFDFPWINDFAAARNAVVERCRGKWFLSIDCDEWLDKDIAQLNDYIRHEQGQGIGMIPVRNYSDPDLTVCYDFVAPRLMRRDGLRFEGAIHESPVFGHGTSRLNILDRTILHHDGYVGLSATQKGNEKLARNLALVREELRQKPDNLRTLWHYLNCGEREPDFFPQLCRALALVEKNPKEPMGPSIFRLAVAHAFGTGRPELEEWIASAERLYPRSYYIRLDVGYIRFFHADEKKQYAAAVRYGENFLDAWKQAQTDSFAWGERIHGGFYRDSAYYQQRVRIFLAWDYCRIDQPKQATKLVETLEWRFMDAELTRKLLWLYLELNRKNIPDIPKKMEALWQGIALPEPSAEKADARKRAFLQAGTAVFPEEPQTAFVVFGLLSGELGDALKILQTEDPELLTELTARQEDLTALPFTALEHAFRYGAKLPPAAQFSGWDHVLATAAVRSFAWGGGQDGLQPSRAFAASEKAWLMQWRGGANELSSIHRFGQQIVRFFEALEKDDLDACEPILREARTIREDMTEMTLYLTAEVRRRKRAVGASREMRELAEKVRTILASLPPDSPDVVALKSSPVYQKLAYLIETG